MGSNPGSGQKFFRMCSVHVVDVEDSGCQSCYPGLHHNLFANILKEFT